MQLVFFDIFVHCYSKFCYSNLPFKISGLLNLFKLHVVPVSVCKGLGSITVLMEVLVKTEKVMNPEA